MPTSGSLLALFIFNLCLTARLIHASADNERKPYIVYMGELPETNAGTGGLHVVNHHNSLLHEAIGDENIAKESKIHSFGKSFNGFVARLLPHEARIIAEKEGVVSVFPNTLQKLHTTRSWDFLNMPFSVRRNLKVESNLIIGVLDTGVWEKSPSFSDKGYGPPPAKWKGNCSKGANFTGCNKKLIGATYYNLNGGPVDDLTPADTDGHGTHTSSIAGGVPVPGASLYGLARGTARGGATAARVAMYKVCWKLGCTDMDLLAGFDAAIADGVDVISVSIGGYPRPYFQDPIAIGSFHAMKKGIFTSCSGGNSGPYLQTIQNVAPWIMTVAASSIDRQFETRVKLGNGQTFSGISINTFSPRKRMYGLTNGAHAANTSRGGFYGNASACDWGTLSARKVKGKVVYCMGTNGQDMIIKELGGAGIISSTDSSIDDVAVAYLLPASTVTIIQGTQIDQYINSTKTATAVIYKSRAANATAPFVASFSSRGPQSISANILKPDIAAPGLSILAAYSLLASVTGAPEDNRFAKFNIISGTSMACPHVAGAAAYVKSFHPKWSPAAIKSALMTTATSMKVKSAEGGLGAGSGQLNPRRAINPGLVYDINQSSYFRFLCKEGYNSTTIRLLTGGKKLYNCSSFKPTLGSDGLNYPSMHLQLNKNATRFSAVFYRTVTNVGKGKSVYKATVKLSVGLNVTVVPNTLSFDKVNQKRSFKVVVRGEFAKDKGWMLSTVLEWRDFMHRVRSPILVYRHLSFYY
ncbi:Cucumisin [Bertholletia excelsa]